MSTADKSMKPEGAIGRTLSRIVRRRREHGFAGRVDGALQELGLNESAFDERVQALLAQVCSACYARDGEAANAHALALEFFLRLTLEYPQLIARAMRARQVFVASISVIRRWQLKAWIPTAHAEEGIDRLKGHLIAQLRSMDRTSDDDDLEREERLRAELHIRQL